MQSDGIYIIKDRLAEPSAAIKTLVTGAYNNRGLDITDLDTFFVHRSTEDWSWNSHEFVQNDDAYSVMAAEHIFHYSLPIYNTWDTIGKTCTHYDPIWYLDHDHTCYSCMTWYEYWAPPPEGKIKETNWCTYYSAHPTIYMPTRPPYYVDAFRKDITDMEDQYSFPTPTESGDILKVTVWAEVRGAAKLAIQLGAGTKYYGTATFLNHRYGWESLEYSAKPGGGSWAWSDLASGNLKAGIYLYYDASGMSSCRRLKVVITTTTGDITIWPDATISNGCMTIAGNYLEDIDLCERLADLGITTLPILQAVRASSAQANKYLTSNLSELAPNFSVISSISVDFAYRSSTPDGNSYVRPYLEIAGTKYYGTSRSLGDSYALQEFSDTWSTNPATSAAWDYDDYKGVRFGLHVYSAANSTYLYLFGLKATTTYQERNPEPEYTQINVQFAARKECAQNPLTADELVFYSSLPIAERVRIAYFRDGAPKFLGFVWSCEGEGQLWQITAKGYQAGLKYRYLPAIEYNPAIDKLDNALSMDDILSDDAPTHPLHYHGGKMAVCFVASNDWVDTPVSDFIMGHESNIGIMALLNSVLVTSYGDSSGKVPGIGGLTVGRQVFGLDRIISQLTYPMRTYTYTNVTTDYGTYYNIYALAGDHHVAWGGSTYVPGYSPAGLRRLAKHTTTTCTDEQYYPDANGDLYLAAWPDSQVLLIHNALDTYIDISENDLSDWCINEAVSIDGQADQVLDNIFELAGQEVVATPGLDGRTHLSAKIANGRGSAISPIRRFVDGDGCKIETQIPVEPLADIALNSGVISHSSTSWDYRRIHLIDVSQIDGHGTTIQSYLARQIDDDKTTYKIQAGMDAITLRPYDHIWVDGIPARVRVIEEYPERVVITAGRKAFDLKEKWAEWRGDADLDSRKAIATNEYEYTSGYPVTASFVVKAQDYARGDLVVMLTLSWDVEVRSSPVNATAAAKAIISLNGNVIAPGKVLLPGKSGSVSIEISDACDKSATDDTTNNLSIQLVDHLTGTNYHTISGKIEQYITQAVLSNA